MLIDFVKGAEWNRDIEAVAIESKVYLFTRELEVHPAYYSKGTVVDYSTSPEDL